MKTKSVFIKMLKTVLTSASVINIMLITRVKEKGL